MIILKKIDVYGQLLIAVISFVFGIVSLYINGPIVIYCFFIGCWQALSAIIHLFLQNKNLCSKDRKKYWITAVFYLLLFCFSATYYSSVLIVPVFYLGLVPAIWYTKITYRELQIWEHRHFIQFR